MTNVNDEEQPWMPGSISSDDFTGPDGWANVNRAPYDQVSGVIYKRAANIKRVRYVLDDAGAVTASPPPGGVGIGEADVRWVFSEQPGSAEEILGAHCFRFLQDVELLPGASMPQAAFPERDTVLYVLAGEGRLCHRPSFGSPIMSRPLRPFDAVLVRSGELFSIANASDAAPFRVMLLGLAPFGAAQGR